MATQLLELEEVSKKTKLASTTIYKFIKEKNFPKPGKFGRRSLWKEDLIDKWIETYFEEDAAS